MAAERKADVKVQTGAGKGGKVERAKPQGLPQVLPQFGTPDWALVSYLCDIC
jgi:hypothetical protein